MKIIDFQDHIPQVMMDRGYQYFLDQRVFGLEKIAPGMWMAEVRGSDVYSVEVNMNRNTIKDWDCDCPYDEGAICKHSVAVLYAIAEKIDKNKRGPKRTDAKQKDPAGEIFKKLDKAEMEKFIREQFQSYKGLKNSFVAHFAEYLEEETYTKYGTIVRNLYKAAAGRYDYLDNKASRNLARELKAILTKASQWMAKGEIMDALNLCKVLIEELPVFRESVDDSSGALGDVFESAVRLFEEASQVAPPMVKDDLFDYCLKEFPKPKYHYSHDGEWFLSLMLILITTRDQENRFFRLLDKRLGNLDESVYKEYTATMLVMSKITFLMNRGRKVEAIKVAKEYDNYPDIRAILYKEAVESGDKQKALMIANDGIRLAQKANHSGVVNDWTERILELAKETGDKSLVREKVEELYFNKRHQIEFFGMIKETYSENEWPSVCEAIIDKIRKGPKGYWGQQHIVPIANIYVVEERWEDLYLLISTEAQFETLTYYANYLSPHYPDEIVNMYTKGIRKHAEETGRARYRKVSSLLKALYQMPGGKQVTYELIDQFRTLYSNRSAMMEILNKQFPDSIKPLKGKEVQKAIDKNLGLFD